MIIEFSVENYRSIRDRCTLSLVANNKDRQLPDNLIEVSLPGLRNTKLLKSAVIYGANASGKSNILKAAGFMSGFVAKSAVELGPEDETGVAPFLLDTECQSKPSRFEAIFILSGVRYQYGFIVDRRKVHEEWLYAYPLGRQQRWFQRSLQPETGSYKWDFSKTHFRGDHQALLSKTRENALFLSTGAQWNDDQLKDVFLWFKWHFRFLDCSSFAPSTMAWFGADILSKNEWMRETVAGLLRTADLGICDVTFEKIPADKIVLSGEVPDALKEALAKELNKNDMIDIRWLHAASGQDAPVQFTTEDESSGTLKFFGLLAAWVDTLQEGYTVLVDEIAANMHPLLLRFLIQAMHNPSINQSAAQVVMTTHDTNLLDTSLFRRDQIWFTEKDKSGGTDLYPLTEYKPRKDEALQKGYLAGRYGAIPFFKGELSF